MRREESINIRLAFHSFVGNELFHLPLKRKKEDFYQDLHNLFDGYRTTLKEILIDEEMIEMKKLCDGILESLKQYHNGLPHKAYGSFEKLMRILEKRGNQLVVFQKSSRDSLFDFDDPLRLYRVRKLTEEGTTTYERKDIFHTPFSLREKISTCRYSISGYPCLYLGTSLELCAKEIENDSEGLEIASRFKMNRNINANGNVNIRVLNLGIKPQDFHFKHNDVYLRGNSINDSFQRKYLLWYPLIAACSFMSKNKKNPYSPEYVIPQLLMQWARGRYANSSRHSELIGIRYFSCASVASSELGFNYVFPVSGQTEGDPDAEHCYVLRNAFLLTQPIRMEGKNYGIFQKKIDSDKLLQYL